MKTIFKYQLPVAEQCNLDLPKGADIIRVDGIEGFFYLWAIIDTEEKETETRSFELYKTGGEMHPNLDDLTYIGYCTIFIQMELCLYVFEKKQSK